MDKLKIFISGTQDDLQPERQAVANAIRALGHEPVMAETYGAQPMPSLSAIREMIDRADIYVGVYGAHYGTPMDSGVSVTEFEFTEFRRKHPDRVFIYVKKCTPEPEQAAFLERVQDFKEGYFRRPLSANTTQLAKQLKEDLSQFIARVVHEKLRGTPDAALIKTYLEEVAKQKPYVLWNDQTYIDRAVAETDNLFVRTVTRYDPHTHELAKKARPVKLEKALKRARKLVLLGEPGLGKTTSLVHLAWDAANRAIVLPHGGDIPIFIELKYYSGEAELETLLSRRMNEVLRARKLMLAVDPAESMRIVKMWLSQPDAHFLLLLDGLNEVRPEYHTAVRGALQSLLNYPHCMVISCRERDYDESLRDRANAFVLQRLQENEIRDHLQRTLGDKGAELFDMQIRRDEKMLTLAANPLMLWFIGIVAQGDPKVRLPANRGKLFQQFVVQMPRLRSKEGIHSEVSLDVVTTALAKLGYEMQEHRRLAVSLGDARGWRIPTASRQLEDVLAQAKDWRFLKADGRLGEPIEFLHQLFLEYFAALQFDEELQKRRDFDEVWGERPFNGGWDEVIMMLAGISSQSVELVKWLGVQVVARKQAEFALTVHRCWETSDAALDSKARQAVISALVIAVRDPSQRLQIGALDALAKIGSPAVDLLIASLRDPEIGVRWRLTNALKRLGTSAVEPLIQALQDPISAVREGAAEALGKIRDPRTVEPLIVALSDPFAVVRERAAKALGEVRDKNAVGPLEAALRDPDMVVCRYAAYALGQIPDSHSVESLIVALREPDEGLRKNAAFALGQISDSRAVEQLVAALCDPCVEVRRNAAHALGLIVDVQSVNPLIEALHDSDVEVRNRAASALGKIRDRHAVNPLIAALRDSDATVRWRAAQALGRIGDARAIRPLIATLRAPNSGAGFRAAEALGEIGDPRALPDLDHLARKHRKETETLLLADEARKAARKIRQRMKDARRTQAD